MHGLNEIVKLNEEGHRIVAKHFPKTAAGKASKRALVNASFARAKKGASHVSK